jgi:hypothetical protein
VIGPRFVETEGYGADRRTIVVDLPGTLTN